MQLTEKTKTILNFGCKQPPLKKSDLKRKTEIEILYKK